MNDKEFLRTVDANTNRLCEGLRVVEDLCRFFLDKADIAKALRKIRHSVRREISRTCPLIESFRNTEADVGKKFPPGKKHTGPADLLRSNINRIQESLRVLEENTRCFDPPRAPKLGQ